MSILLQPTSSVSLLTYFSLHLGDNVICAVYSIHACVPSFVCWYKIWLKCSFVPMLLSFLSITDASISIICCIAHHCWMMWGQTCMIFAFVNSITLFLSGMPFYQAVNILRSQDSSIKGVQVWYSEQVCTHTQAWKTSVAKNVCVNALALGFFFLLYLRSHGFLLFVLFE